jgi:hypothetical protein
MALGGCNYEDGPVISLRSKGARMDFFRPLTYYESNGIDSTAAIIQLIEDSIPEFTGYAWFDYEPSQEIQGIYSTDDFTTASTIGSWFIEGFDDFERIAVYISGSTWPDRWWTITRLTHRKLWLEGPGGRLLRFEE